VSAGTLSSVNRPLEATATATLEAAPPRTAIPIAPAPKPTAADPLGALVLTALTAQDGLAPLMANLIATLGGSAWPDELGEAMAEVLDQQQPLDALTTGDRVQTALVQSGLLLEARLAAGLQPAASGDLKSALLVLQERLRALAGERPEAPQTSPRKSGVAPPPPIAGARPVAQSAPPATLAAPLEPQRLAGQLLQQTTAALARQTLHQLASAMKTQAPGEAGGARWLFEVPVAADQGASTAQVEIRREPPRRGGDEDRPHWRVRFSIAPGELGRVDAELVIRGDHARISLWAEQADTAAALARHAAELAQAPALAAFSAEVTCRHGAPPADPPPAPGRLLDRAL